MWASFHSLLCLTPSLVKKLNAALAKNLLSSETLFRCRLHQPRRRTYSINLCAAALPVDASCFVIVRRSVRPAACEVYRHRAPTYRGRDYCLFALKSLLITRPLTDSFCLSSCSSLLRRHCLFLRANVPSPNSRPVLLHKFSKPGLGPKPCIRLRPSF